MTKSDDELIVPVNEVNAALYARLDVPAGFAQWLVDELVLDHGTFELVWDAFRKGASVPTLQVVRFRPQPKDDYWEVREQVRQRWVIFCGGLSKTRAYAMAIALNLCEEHG